MGVQRRIKKQMAKRVCLADTKADFNGHRILIACSSPAEAGRLGKLFAEYMAFLNGRANQVNMVDIQAAHLKVLEKMESGKDFLVN